MAQNNLSKLGLVLAIGFFLILGLGGGIQCVKSLVGTLTHPAPSYAACVQLNTGSMKLPEGGNTIAVRARDWRVFSSTVRAPECGVGIYNKGAAEISYTSSALLEVGKAITEACFAPAKAEAAAAGGWTTGFCKTDGFDIVISTKDSFYTGFE